MICPRSKKNLGFSLPEVLIVVLIIAILVVLAVPQLNASMQLNRLQTSSTIIAAKLSEAKAIAVKQNKSISFVVDKNNMSVWVESNSTVIGAVEGLPQNIKIKTSPNSTAVKEYITFNSMGNLVTAPATIYPYYEAENLELPITISISGKIKIGTIQTY